MGECIVPGCYEYGRYVIVIDDEYEERYCEFHYKKLPKELREKAIDLGKLIENIK
jgi:hypothetical protein